MARGSTCRSDRRLVQSSGLQERFQLRTVSELQQEMSVTPGPPMGFFGVGVRQSPKPVPKQPTEVEAPGQPPPPSVGRVTHYSLELIWAEALGGANVVVRKGDRRVRVTVQQQDKSGGWAQVYTGYAKRHVFEDLEACTDHNYRIRFTNEAGTSDWSPPTTASTGKEPVNGEHIHKAVQRNDVALLQNLLDSGRKRSYQRDMPVDCPDKLGFTPLMAAAQKGYVDIIEVLVKHKADVNFQNDAGKTCLMMAAFSGQMECVKKLRELGANYELQDRGGSTVLHWAVDGKNHELMAWMLEDGAPVNSTDTNGWTPLLRVGTMGGDRSSAETLLKHGADVNVTDKTGKSALMIAVVNGHMGMVEALLEAGADLQIKNEFGNTAYEMAISMERRGVIRTMEEFMDKNGIKRI